MRYESGTLYYVPLDEWYVVGPPIWEDHFPRARNWLARITENPNVPGGFTREWCERGKGRLKYSVASLLEGDTIEFGADRIWADGEGRTRLRWVGEIVEMTDTKMYVCYFDTPEELFHFIYERESRLQEANP